MPYLATKTTVDRTVAGRLNRQITVVETGVVDNTAEFTLPPPPSGHWKLTYHKAVLATGGAGITATSIDSQVGESSGAAGSSSVWSNGVAGLSLRNTPNALGEATTAYGRSMANGNIGSTGTITTVLVMVEGHQS